jgi:hypothetical protein
MYMNRIELKCYKLGAGARTTSQIDTQGASVGQSSDAGGSQFGPYTCDENKSAIGIRGKAGEYVDSFGLICGYIMPTAPVLLTPVNATDVTAKRPTFDWDPASRITQPYKVCMNLTSTAGCAISGTLTASVSKSNSAWTPTADLPFQRGDVVYWRVEACNENGCKNAVKSFRYMPAQ